MKRKRVLLGCLSLLILSGITRALASFEALSYVPLDHPAIRYYEAQLDDPIGRLAKRMAAGAIKLKFRPGGLGYLPSLLQELGIQTDSQILVFSKTSFQSPLISPKTPRAIFFNDAVAIGSVQNSQTLEFASLDPKQGVVFYTMDNEPGKPMFDRRDVCVQCHQSPATLGVPGIMISSVYPSGDGMPSFRSGFVATDHRSHMEDRWGGWYVSGTSGGQGHRGNATAPDPTRPQMLDMSASQNLTSLAKKVTLNPATYLAQTSDIVALMTLEHQTRMTDLFVRIGWDTRVAEQENKLEDTATLARLENQMDDLVIYMLYADEARIREPIEGVSTFTATFPKQGPRDRQGRSLRDFDLQTRLFKYPISYMVYSEAFDGMPDWARNRIYQKIYDVLTGKNTSDTFARLTPEDRRAALEILLDTKSNLPAYWRGETERTKPLTAGGTY